MGSEMCIRDRHSYYIDYRNARPKYLEAFVVVRAKFEGVTYSRCVLIWVTTDFAIGRGWFQGYPKKLGSVFVTRPYSRGVAVLLVSERGRGSHASLTFGGRTAVIPHQAAELKKGTLHGILKQLEIKLEDLR